MSMTTTDKILNNEAVDCSGFMWSNRIEYKPLPPNGGMLIRTREPITPEYEFTISKDAIAPTCPNEPIFLLLEKLMKSFEPWTFCDCCHDVDLQLRKRKTK